MNQVIYMKLRMSQNGKYVEFIHKKQIIFVKKNVYLFVHYVYKVEIIKIMNF